MTSTTDVELISSKPTATKSRKRSAFDWSLIFGIVLIGLFLCLFVLEFSRILSLTGRVNHTTTAMPIIEKVATGHHST